MHADYIDDWQEEIKKLKEMLAQSLEVNQKCLDRVSQLEKFASQYSCHNEDCTFCTDALGCDCGYEDDKKALGL